MTHLTARLYLRQDIETYSLEKSVKILVTYMQVIANFSLEKRRATSTELQYPGYSLHYWAIFLYYIVINWIIWYCFTFDLQISPLPALRLIFQFSSLCSHSGILCADSYSCQERCKVYKYFEVSISFFQISIPLPTEISSVGPYRRAPKPSDTLNMKHFHNAAHLRPHFEAGMWAFIYCS